MQHHHAIACSIRHLFTAVTGCCLGSNKQLHVPPHTTSAAQASRLSLNHHAALCPSINCASPRPRVFTDANLYALWIAGMGLFLQGAALPGSLLALFPGLVYHKPVYRCEVLKSQGKLVEVGAALKVQYCGSCLRDSTSCLQLWLGMHDSADGLLSLLLWPLR